MLRIVTLNLNYYVDKHGPWETRKKLIIDQLQKTDPHIVAFQAVAKDAKLYDGKDQAFQICEELSGFQSHYFQEAQTTSEGLQQGSAIISKFHMLDKSFQNLSLLQGFDDTNKRALLKATFKRPNGTFNFYNAHFSWVHEQATKNVEEALQFMQKDNAPSLLAGDLNTLSDSTAFVPFKQAGMIDAWQQANGDKEGFTFESDKPSIRIDYFWISSELAKELNKVEIISHPQNSNARLSDHLGLMLELNVKV
ncbi:endonuclease/exonuclease/phosphatase family protein [Chryseosolibacter indicus]|uniref:Endonuclease/exonuclease/phosphatase family protein n=1 Tax=Chryseosolibacter indicus TaxID=2782351 RepID=A0ABS5VQ03_9BACT|nr:endonuclease/exonuclease/phosphatase family protein [Chryseosolibacter indicus]MBT1702859.1 endonuclease/exonuclease/phosphatase family protein [Chryseosolibacter indicus]